MSIHLMVNKINNALVCDTAVIQRCNDNPLRIIEMNSLVQENVSVIKEMHNRT